MYIPASSILEHKCIFGPKAFCFVAPVGVMFISVSDAPSNHIILRNAGVCDSLFTVFSAKPKEFKLPICANAIYSLVYIFAGNKYHGY